MRDSHSHEHGDVQNIRLAFILNISFTLLELVGGFLTNSVAVLSDALHDLGDSLALGTAWYLSRVSEREGDVRYSYGYRRYSLLGALINTLVLVVGAAIVLWQAIPRLAAPETPNAGGMALLAVVGIAVNGFAAWRLRGGRQLNTQAVAWHLLEDVLGWVAILVVSIVLLFADVPRLDPLLSIGITLFVLYQVAGRLRATVRLFLQAVPEDVDLEELQRRIRALPDVSATHHTHIWSLDGEHHVLTTHIVLAEGRSHTEQSRLKEQVRKLLAENSFEHTTIEVETFDEYCAMRRAHPETNQDEGTD